mmetsp:Transcript_35532/g.68462  ORF Transcript_35532/g.68462 Transcript_35532/m.68462 type:complete len:244 (-) Transcript_35532:73-804(-)
MVAVGILDFFQWLTVLHGTGLGSVLGCVCGLSKLVGVGPYEDLHRAMIHGFQYVYGPILGLNGDILRMFIGCGEATAGIGLILGLWMDVLGWLGYGDFQDFTRGLIIIASMGLLGEMGVAAVVHHSLADRDDDSDDDSVNEDYPYGDKVKFGPPLGDGKSIELKWLPFCYAIQLTLFAVIRAVGFCPHNPWIQTLCVLLSISLLVLAGFVVLSRNELGLHRREIEHHLIKLDREQAEMGGILI